MSAIRLIVDVGLQWLHDEAMELRWEPTNGPQYGANTPNVEVQAVLSQSRDKFEVILRHYLGEMLPI
jgi:hypothetical protein